MDFYWIYDLPNWLFFLIPISLFVGFALIGSFFVNEKLEKYLGLSHATNEIIAIFLGLSGVFYGITLGLIAVGTFENFNSTEEKVLNESSALASLYRDVSILEQPEREVLKSTLKAYTNYVVNEAWPMQRKGEVPKGGTKLIDIFQQQLGEYNPMTDKDKIIYSEVFDQYNVLIEKRRLRLNAVNSGLPATIWLVLFIGSAINIVLTWLLVIKNKKLDILINTLISFLLGSLIFLIAAMDNPFRGDYSVSAESFQRLLDDLMK